MNIKTPNKFCNYQINTIEMDMIKLSINIFMIDPISKEETKIETQNLLLFCISKTFDDEERVHSIGNIKMT